MRGRRTASAALLAGVAATIVLASATAAAPTGSGSSAHVLRGEIAALAGSEHRALLDLYALDSRLQAAQARLASLESQAAAVRARQAGLAQQLLATRQTLATSQRSLERQLRALYEQGDVDPLAVMLGARSLDDAMTQLDDLSRVADESRRVVDVAAGARGRLARLSAALAAQRARLRVAVDGARRSAGALADARAARVAYLARVRQEQQLKARQVAELEAAARQVATRAASIQAASAPPAQASPDPATAPAAGARTITVVATGYSLSGATATGVPAGPGVVAVDPSVIPLGTQLTIPGYGEGVASDTGVSGTAIDLWFPSAAAAQAWGRRTVTITLH